MLRRLGPAVPYVAVVVGLYLLKNAWVSIALYHIVIIVGLALSGNLRSIQKCFRGFRPAVAAASGLVCVLAGPLILLLWPHISPASTGGFANVLAGYGLTGPAWCLFMPYFVLVHPALEEIYWREWLDDGNAGISWMDGCFGGYHLLVLVLFIRIPWAVLSVMVLVVVAWIWRRQGRRYKGLAVPLLGHIAADAGVMMVANHLMRTQ